jgi:hypothetical protein
MSTYGRVKIRAGDSCGRRNRGIPPPNPEEKEDNLEDLPIPLRDRTYCFATPRAPRRQDLQIPKPVPLAWMKLQSAVTAVTSPPGAKEAGVKVPLRNGTLTALWVPGVELGSSVEPQASMPSSTLMPATVAGLQTVKAPVLSVPGSPEQLDYDGCRNVGRQVDCIE